MKKKLTALAAGVVAIAATVSVASAQDSITLQLKWVTQAQFAGYLVAEAKGYYDEENLDVTILPGGPNVAPETVIAGGGADIIVDWIATPSALHRVERTHPRPRGVKWELLSPEQIEATPPLRELQRLRGQRAG